MRIATLTMLVLLAVACGSTEYKPFVADAGDPGPTTSLGDAGGTTLADSGALSPDADGGTPLPPPPAGPELFSAGIADPKNPSSALALGEIAVDATNVYVIARGSGRAHITQTPKSASTQSTELGAAPGFSGLALGPQSVYVGAGSGDAIFQVPLAVIEAPTIFASTPAMATMVIASNADHVFWIDGTTVHGKAKLGGVDALLQSDALMGSVSALALAADDQFLYWTNTSGIVRAPAAGGGTIQTVVPNGSGPIATDDTRLYFVKSNAVTCDIDAVSKAGGSIATVISTKCASDNGGAIKFIAVDDTYVWWTTADNHVLRTKKM